MSILLLPTPRAKDAPVSVKTTDSGTTTSTSVHTTSNNSGYSLALSSSQSGLSQSLSRESQIGLDRSLRLVSSLQEVGYTNTFTVLGQGAASRVLRYRTVDGSVVAVKFISKLRHPKHYRHTPCEVVCLRKLRDHPSVVHCLDALQTDTEVCIITEEFGVDLERWQKTAQDMRIKYFPRGVSRVCAEYHTAACPRDLRPPRHHTAGAPRYQAPERPHRHGPSQAHRLWLRRLDAARTGRGRREGGPLGTCRPSCSSVPVKNVQFESTHENLCKADIFALGVVAYNLVFGRPPFRINDLCDVVAEHPKESRFSRYAEEMLKRTKGMPVLYPRGFGCSLVPRELKEFLRGLLELNSQMRWNIKAAITSAWMSKRGDGRHQRIKLQEVSVLLQQEGGGELPLLLYVSSVVIVLLGVVVRHIYNTK